MGWRLVYDPPGGAPHPPAPLGASKLGGTPDLPPGVEWPRSRRDGTPTAFIGQLAVADFDGAVAWPGRDRDLLLSCFCDLDPDAAYAEGPDAGILLAHRLDAGLHGTGWALRSPRCWRPRRRRRARAGCRRRRS